MRPLAALVLVLLAPAVAYAGEDDGSKPARTGIERFEDHHHELGIVHGSGGPLAGVPGRIAVDGLRYHEANGEILDAFFGAIFGIIDSTWDKRVDCKTGACVFLDATVYLPHLLGDRQDPGAKGGIVEFGLSAPTRTFTFQVAASVGWVTARVPDTFIGDARDALALAMHFPLASWLTFMTRVDLNLFALYPKKVMKEWRTDSPVTLGLHADLGRRLYANVDLIRGDLVKGGEGWLAGGGLRF